MKIETERLWLVPARPEVLKADLVGPNALAGTLGIAIAPEWPPSAEYDADAVRYMIALQERQPEALIWGFRYIVVKEPQPLVVGAGGYTGPATDNEIEIGYSVCPAWRQQGFASEATRGLVRTAFENSSVARVIAHTFPHLTPSIGVLEKCGFRLTGPGAEAGTVRYAIERRDWKGKR